MPDISAMLCPNPDCPDVQETGTPGEYRQDVERCPRCGTTLEAVQLDTSEPVNTSDHGVALEPVFESLDPTEVVVIQSMLSAEGIPCQVSPQGIQRHLGGQLSPFPVHPVASGVVVISVPAALAETAREILSKVETEA